MRVIFWTILVAASLSWSICFDHDRDIVECFYDTTDVWPTYSDGQAISKGNDICWNTLKSGYAVTHADSAYGISFVVKHPYKQVCRFVMNIFLVPISDYKFVADTGFCLRKYSSSANQETCVRHKWETKKQYYKKNVYITEYSKNKTYTQNYEATPEYEIIQNERVFYNSSTNIVELYREDGTLRYEGTAQFQDKKLLTHGHCFDKANGNMGRKTNNPDICK